MHQFTKYTSAFVHSASRGAIGPLVSNIDSQTLAQYVLELSDLYNITRGDLTKIWTNEKLKSAYLQYFLPLNILRLQYVLQHANELQFFSGLESVIDFGSGPGTLDFALLDNNILFQSSSFIEKSNEAIALHKDILASLKIAEGAAKRKWANAAPQVSGHATLATFCYSLNEITSLPEWALKSEALLIVEPSLSEHARNLQKLRMRLIAEGFHIWAPCTHHDSCPLIEHSKTDWCHQRVHVELPQSLQEIERFLPMKNKTVTFSYLLARRTAPARTSSARIIGDTQHERGKIKQAVCRNSKREFLTWLTRFGEPAVFERGSLVDIPESAELKGNEIRMPKL